MKITILISLVLLLVACRPAAPAREEAAPSLPNPREPVIGAPEPTAPPEPAPTSLHPATEPLNIMPPAHILPLSAYPPGDTPYLVADGDFWLAHTPSGRLFAFAPRSPDYEARPGLEPPCRYTWSESAGRFIDPCSGDAWELTGAMSLEHSRERWSGRDLDQYHVVIQEGQIIVQTSDVYRGLAVAAPPSGAPPLPWAAQYGITITVVAADFAASATVMETMVQVDPIWQMDAAAFPPQQALTYPTFPDSLFDDQGGVTESTSRQGGLAVDDAQTGGIRVMTNEQWQVVPPGAGAVTATLTVHLSNLYRQVNLPLDWQGREVGDEWLVDLPLELGYASARLRQVTWKKTMSDGRAHLKVTVSDDSPADIRLYCLHLDTEDPWRGSCANFDKEKSYTIFARPGEPLVLHLRADLELLTPFQLVVAVIR
jgi:hypothetical protein